MKTNFSISRDNFQPNTEVKVNGYTFVYTAIAPRTEGKGTEVYGILTFPDGKQKSYLEKPVLVSMLNKIAGATVSRSDISKKETSQSKGSSKVISISSLSEEKVQQMVTDKRVKMVKLFNKLSEQFIFDTNDLDCAFYRSLNETLSEYHKELREKLAEQRAQLDRAKQIELKKLKQKRIALLESYINNYDTRLGAMMFKNMKKAQIMMLTKKERIIRAGLLIDEIKTELLLDK